MLHSELFYALIKLITLESVTASTESVIKMCGCGGTNNRCPNYICNNNLRLESDSIKCTNY